MKADIPALVLAHLRGESLTTALLWRIRKNDDSELLATDHDRTIIIPGIEIYSGTYFAGANVSTSALRSTDDLAVDNMEVAGALQRDATRFDVSQADINAGLYSNAQVSIFLCNWRRPEDGAYTVKRGYLGDIVADSDGQYVTELRGLLNALAQQFMRTYGERCEVRDFGDAECGFDLAAVEETGTVTAVTNRRRFDATISGPQPAGSYSLGTLTFTSGDNEGVTREIRADDEDDVAGHLSLWDQLPYDVELGDTFTIRPGCDRRESTCIGYDNILNFRGYGIYIEGADALMAGPMQARG